MLQIYLDPMTVNSRKVLAALEYLGTEYEFHYIDYLAGQHKSPEYLAINPSGTVPSMIDGDLLLTESNAILQYCGELAGYKAYPADIKGRANVNRWLLWEASVWFAQCYIYLVEYVVKPVLSAQPDESIIDAAAPRFHQLAKVLDDQLGKTKWVAGPELTIADFAVASPMHLHAAQKLPLDKYPNIVRWVGQIESVPAWKNTQAAVDKVLLPEAQPAGGMEAAVDTEMAKQPHGVVLKTTVKYSKETEQPTEIYFYESDKAADVHAPGDDEQEITVHSAWSRVNDFSIDREGFSLHTFHSSVKDDDWDQDDIVRKQLYPEVIEFLKKNVGAKRVLVFDHTIRSNKNDNKKWTDEKNTTQRNPVMLVHCDYTNESAPLRVRQLLPDEASELLTRRVAFINVWKPIRNAVHRDPLTMCDVTSSPSSDFFRLYLRYRDRDGENYVLKYSKEHMWYYFPKMTPEQVILLKTYDSETDGRARFVGHSAIKDPNAPADAPMRESIEIRTIAFF